MCEAISGYFVVLAQNCLESTVDYTVMQMRKINHEKGLLPVIKFLFSRRISALFQSVKITDGSHLIYIHEIETFTAVHVHILITQFNHWPS